MNCFAPLTGNDLKKRVLLKDIVFDTKREQWQFVPKASKLIDADGVSQDIIVYTPVKTGEYDIAEYVKSFSDEVGIQNILKKLALSGDRSLLNQTGRVGEKPDGGLEEIKDYTDVPGSKTEAFNAVAAGVSAYDALPADICTSWSDILTIAVMTAPIKN